MKPILFNTPMVRAIRNNEKTETRRLITLPDGMTGSPVGEAGSPHNPLGFMYPGGIKRPRYLPGDVLYVRETWQYAYDADGNDQMIEGSGRYLYAADDCAPFNDWVMPDGTHRDTMPWRPSIHMPKKAARTFILVADVKVERLHEITVEGIRNEGIRLKPREEECKCAWEEPGCRQEPCGNRDAYLPSMYISKFATLWDSTIKDDRYLLDSWQANPWVWVYKFEQCAKPEGE